MRAHSKTLCVCFLLLLYAGAGSNAIAHRKFSGARRSERRSERVVYVALGDSTGVGVGAQRGGYVARLFARIRRRRRRARLHNLCASAATTENLIERQMPLSLRLQPTL